MSKNIYLDNLVSFSTTTYSNLYQNYINQAKLDINNELSKLKNNNSINEKGVFIQYNYVELATLMDLKYNELVLLYPLSFNIENINIEWYNFLNALLLVLNPDYFNQANNIKKKYLDSLNEQLEKKVDLKNSKIFNNDKIFENIINAVNINLIILNNTNNTKIKIYNNNLSNKYIVIYKIDNDYLPVCNFNTKYYLESSSFVKYLQEEYEKIIELNKDELNKDELNKDELNKDELNKDELNKNELNKKELNKKELNKKELNKKELNKNKEELNKNKEELNINDYYDEFQTVEDYTLHVSEAIDKNNKKNKELNSDNKKKKKNDKNIFITNKVEKKKEGVEDSVLNKAEDSVLNKAEDSVFNKTEIITKDEIIKTYESFKTTTKLEDIQILCLKIDIPIFAGSTKDGKPKNKTKTELLEEIKKYIK